jgi:hypothetical protein
MMRRYEETADRARPLIEWRAVFGGAVFGLAFFAVLSVLWYTLSVGTDVAIVQDKLPWFIAGSAIASMLFGGYFAGLFASVRGGGAGFVNGSAVWALTLLVGVGVGVPVATGIFDVTAASLDTATSAAVAPATTITATVAWATLWAMLIGLGAAAVGGMIGGASPRATMPHREIVLDGTIPQHTHPIPAGPMATQAPQKQRAS